MGNQMTKLLALNQEVHEEKEVVESSPSKNDIETEEKMSTPVVVQKHPIMDPRSATTGIQRTPIQTNIITPITFNRRIGELSSVSKPYLETDLDRVMPPLTPRKCEPRLSELSEPPMEICKDYLTPTMRNRASFPRKLTPSEKERFRILGIDPRSPAADFNRTPILTPVSMLRLRARSQEHLSRRGSYDGDVCKFSYCETLSKFGIPEVQALPDLAVTAIEALNLIDTDCSNVLNEFESSCSSDSPNSVILWSPNENNSSPELKNIKNNIQKSIHTANASPDTEDSSIKHKESLKKVKVCLTLEDCEVENTNTEVTDKQVVENAKGSKKISDTDDKIIVWRDSMSTLPQVEQTEIEQIVTKVGETMQPPKDLTIGFENDIVIRDNLSSKISKAPGENQRKLETIKRNKNTKGEKSISEDKKIFSDKTCSDTAKMRTPLGNRSNNGPVFLGNGMSPQQILRKKGITPKMLQENTPPHRRSMAKSKLAGIQWDPDSTVLI